MENGFSTKIHTNRYMVLCTGENMQKSATTNEITTVNKAELRLKMRSSVEMMRRSTVSKDHRAATLPSRFHNYRYGTLPAKDGNSLEQRKSNMGRFRRFESVPNISESIEPTSSRHLPTRPTRFSENNKLQKTKIKTEKLNIDYPVAGDGTSTQQVAREKTNIRSSISEFLAKPNPDKPPPSLRVQRPKIGTGATVFSKKYQTVKETDENTAKINPSNAPLLNVFAEQPWYYQEKASWRYLRIKEPAPLSVDNIFKRPTK